MSKILIMFTILISLNAYSDSNFNKMVKSLKTVNTNDFDCKSLSLFLNDNPEPGIIKTVHVTAATEEKEISVLFFEGNKKRKITISRGFYTQKHTDHFGPLSTDYKNFIKIVEKNNEVVKLIVKEDLWPKVPFTSDKITCNKK